MTKTIKYFIFGLAFVAVGLMLGFNFNGRGETSPNLTAEQNAEYEKLREAMSFIQRRYVNEVDSKKLVDDAIQGMVDGLDPHTFYISQKDMKGMREQMSGGFDGIGVEFNIMDDTIYVVTPLAGGPSESLGIKAGDRIVKANGEDVTGDLSTADVMKYLKGPKGSKVLVEILRRGVDDLLSFEITRDRIPIFSVPYAYMIGPKMGYIQVSRFSETTWDEFHEKLVELKAEGMKDLILDLRGNPGGYMNMAYQMADEFLEGGKMIVSTKGRTYSSKNEYKSTNRISDFERGGLVVLMDYGSASASEIVAGAVQDHDRGLIVGVRSFGKGLVQIQNEFSDSSAIRVVISEYFTPSGRCIQKPYGDGDEAYEHEIDKRFESGEIYDPSKADFPDSLKFSTTAGRTVYGGGGIFPDVFIAPDTTGSSRYFAELSSKDLFRSFSYSYQDRHPELLKKYPTWNQFVQGFEVNKTLTQEFLAYSKAHGQKFDSDGYQESEAFILNRIKAYIGRKIYQDDGFYPVYHQLDRSLQKAVKLMPQAIELHKKGTFKLNKE